MVFSKPETIARGSRKQPTRQAVTQASQHAAKRQSGAVPEYQTRRIARKLDELERTNPHDIPISAFHHSTPPDLLQLTLELNQQQQQSQPVAGPSSKSKSKQPQYGKTVLPPPELLSMIDDEKEKEKGKKKKPKTANVKRLLIYKKTLREYLEESPNPTPYTLAVAPPPSRPPRHLCSSCGYHGSYSCNRCGEWSCSRECMVTHLEMGGCGG